MSETTSLGSLADDLATLSSTNWDVIRQDIASTLGSRSTSWGETKSGGYNLVRFLQIENHPDVVVRVPLNHVENPQDAVRSVVATMQYFDERTNIPLPRIICFNDTLGRAGRPYLVTTKAEGVALVDIWDDLSDERREVILGQIVRIVVEMYSHRFGALGALSRDPITNGWIIEAPRNTEDVPRAYSSGTDYWIDYANDRLAAIVAESTSSSAIYQYAHIWWMRSLIPSLYDNSLDRSGFPIMHGDFHSQNIFVVDPKTDNPRVSSIIDWDGTRTVPTNSFAQPPFFLVDHPLADLEDEKTQMLIARNAQDQQTYAQLLKKEEVARFPNHGRLTLSDAFKSWEGVYLFEQCIEGGVLYHALWDTLVKHVVGDKAAFNDYIFTLVEKGHLKSVADQIERRMNVSSSE